jgi:hypothetical protein
LTLGFYLRDRNPGIIEPSYRLQKHGRHLFKMSTTFVWGTDTELSTLDVFVPTSGPALTTLHVDIGPTTRSEDELVWPPEAPSNTEPITTGPEM